MLCLANKSPVPLTVEPGDALAVAALPPEGSEFHRRGPHPVTGVTGSVVYEKDGALMETDGEEVEFSGADRVLHLESCEQAS